MEETLYVLTVVHNVDDYKHRGEEPSTTTTYSYSKEHLCRLVVDMLNEDKEEEEQLDRRPSGGWSGHMDLLMVYHNDMTKGEYVPHKWNFTIEPVEEIESSSEEEEEEEE
jgi:hypothetical protein